MFFSSAAIHSICNFSCGAKTGNQITCWTANRNPIVVAIAGLKNKFICMKEILVPGESDMIYLKILRDSIKYVFTVLLGGPVTQVDPGSHWWNSICWYKNTDQSLYLGEWTRELTTAQGFLINVTVPKPVQKKINSIPKLIKTSGQTTSMGKSNKLERKIHITCLESYLNHRPPQLRTRVFPI